MLVGVTSLNESTSRGVNILRESLYQYHVHCATCQYNALVITRYIT